MWVHRGAFGVCAIILYVLKCYIRVFQLHFTFKWYVGKALQILTLMFIFSLFQLICVSTSIFSTFSFCVKCLQKVSISTLKLLLAFK